MKGEILFVSGFRGVNFFAFFSVGLCVCLSGFCGCFNVGVREGLG